MKSESMTQPSNIFLSEGLRIQTGGNEPFSVNDPQQAWFAKNGVVDLFVVPMADGKPAGPRTHLLRAGAGQMILGVQADGAPNGVALLAVGGPESHVYRLPVKLLAAAATNPVAAAPIQTMLETWITALYSALTAGLAPTECEVVEAGFEISAEPGSVIRPADKVLWIRHTAGRSLLAGLAELKIEAGHIPLPFATSAWFVTEETTTLSCFATETLIGDPQLWRGLTRFGQLASRWAAARIAAADKSEGARLHAKAGAQLLALHSAVSHLSAVLAPRGQLPPAATDDDPLVVACRWVGQAMELHIASPTSARSSWKRKDPLAQIAKASHVRIRRVVLSGDWWRQDAGPLLAFRAGSDQPVALLPVSATRYQLADPVTGTRETVTEEVARKLSSVAHCFCPTFPDQALKVWQVFQLGLRNVQGEIVTVLATALGGVALGMVFPIITGLVFDTVIPTAARSQLWYLAAALLAASGTEIILGLTESVALMRLETKSDVRIQAAVWDRLLRLPLPFYAKYTSGDLAVRANGINAIRQMLSGVMITSLLSGVFSVLYFALLCYYSPTLTLVACGLAVLNLAVIASASAFTLRLQRPLCELEGKISGMVLQFIAGIAKLRVAGAEPQAFAVWAKAFSAQKQLDWRAGLISNGYNIFNELFPTLTYMLLFAGTAFWAEPKMSTGKFLAFSTAFMTFLHATIGAGAAVMSVVHALPLYERAKPILVALPEVAENQADPGLLTGRLELDQLCFRYKADAPPVLQDVSLQIKAGEFVAIVGPSGSGKSTLLRLLLGFERPESGAIFYDGLDMSGLDIQAIRRQCGVVLQNGKLMPGDIFENIVGAALFTLEDAWEAARLAGLEEDIRAMPMGMHTVIGEGTGTLSGGQRQRLMIARAIVAKPRILLFDEATSACDNRTQAIVSRSLESLKATRIVIAHRLSTIQNVDRIHVLVKGHLVQSGTFEELSAQAGPFADLVRRQVA
jgi:NHLM bacteriocin system ABC transporter ATP-binding protein